jgi:hypothetical protein
MIRDLLVKGVGQLTDMGGQAALAGREHALVGVREAGEIERQELVESPLGLAEARLELARRGAERRDGGRPGRGRRRTRIAHEGLTRGGIRGHTPGGEEGLGLPGAQAVAHDGLGQPCLLAAGHAGQGGGGGGRQAAVIDMRGHLGGEPPAQSQAPLHPGAPVPAELDDLRGGQVIVGHERVDDTGLVHRAQGAPGRVGLQQTRLGDDPRRRVGFHDHGDVGVPLAAPAGQPLEAVEDLVGPVGRGRGHPQGQRGQGRGAIGARAPQGRQRGGHVLDGHLEDQAHDRASGSGSSW